MIALKMLLTVAGVLLMATAVAIPLYGLWMRIRYAMKKKSGGDGLLLESGVVEPEPGPIAWRGPVALALVACLPLLVATSMVVVPSGMGGGGECGGGSGSTGDGAAGGYGSDGWGSGSASCEARDRR